jgi:Regulator of G protein signaling domain
MSFGSDLKAKNMVMFEYARTTELPAFDRVMADPLWYDVFYYFTQRDYSNENLDFLRKVDQYKKSPSEDAAADLYKYTVATINLSGAVRTPLDAVLGDNAPDDARADANTFEAAEREVRGQLADPFARFEREIAALQEEFGD